MFHWKKCFFFSSTSVPLIMFLWTNTYVPLRISCMFTLSLANTFVFNYYLCSIHHVFGTNTYVPLINACVVFATWPVLFTFSISNNIHHTPFDPLVTPFVTSMQRARFPRDVTTERRHVDGPPSNHSFRGRVCWRLGKGGMRCVEGWLGENWRFVDERWKVDFNNQLQ